MARFLSRFSTWLGKRAFARAERSGRIDEETSFFQVGPSIWRFVELHRCLDFYCDVAGATVAIDVRPLGPWSSAIHAPFGIASVLPAEAPELTDDEKARFLSKIARLAWVRQVSVLDVRGS